VVEFWNCGYAKSGLNVDVAPKDKIGARFFRYNFKLEIEATGEVIPWAK
jgi:hypothetical protein